MFPIMLYPETHFRFGGISPSLLFKKEPEIIFDTPARFRKGNVLPLFLLLNNVHKYPVKLLSLRVGLYQKGEKQEILISEFEQYRVTHPTEKISPAYEVPLSLDTFTTGRIAITPILQYEVRGKIKELITDNLRTTSHTPLTTYIAEEDFPGSVTTSYGDMHCHSIHSRSHVEFGAPIPFYRRAAEVTGLSVVSIIDHTYDLEAKPENYLHRDPSLQNWELQQSQKSTSLPLVLLSQEHSARKQHGGVVHMGVLGYDTFLKGSGDGARVNYKKETELSLEEASREVVQKGGLTFAAHPGEPTTLMQRIFLRRDNWKLEDFTNNIQAIQALNRGIDPSWFRARAMWISLLTAGKKLPLLAGNDAHGDFNRYRAIAYPFISIKEDLQRFFGLARTGFYPKITSQSDLLQTIKQGKTFITTGPFLDIRTNNDSAIGNDTQNVQNAYIITAESTKEFGPIKQIRLHMGTQSGELDYLLPIKSTPYEYSFEIPTKEIQNATYIRAEVASHIGDNGLEGFAATSPVYFR